MGRSHKSLCVQMVEESMKKELVGSQDSYSFMDLFRTATMRLMTVSLSAVWYDTDPAARSASGNVHVTRRLVPQVFDQLRLLRPLHGPPEVRSGHLLDPGDLRSGRHPRQSHHHCDHECGGTASVTMRSPHHSWIHHTGERAGASWYV